MIFISGQVAMNAAGEVIGKNDLRVQTTQVYENIKLLLAEAGVTFADVVKTNTYIVNYKPADLPIIREVRKNFLSAEAPPASTLVGVSSLFHPDLLIEIEVIAVSKK